MDHDHPNRWNRAEKGKLEEEEPQRAASAPKKAK